MRLLARFSFAVIFGVLSLAASPQTSLKREGGSWTQTEQGSLSIDPTGQIKIMAAGDIRVRGGNTSRFTYQVTRKIRAARNSDARAMLERYPVTTSRSGRTALFQIACGPFATTIEITVPRTLDASVIETLGGDIDVSDLNGALVAQASGGKINVGHVGGDIDIRAAGGAIVLGVIGGNARCLSGGGAISASEIRGDAVLETGGGDILLRKAGGKVRASTAGGGIEVLESHSTVVANTFGGPIEIGSAKGVHCESASGSIVARFLPGITVFDSFLSTGSGDITVWIPSNLQISIRAQNEGSGNVRTVTSDFPGLRVRSAGAAVLGEVLINGGGPLLQLAGNGGRIYIRKR
jgi:hypothetical protein